MWVQGALGLCALASLAAAVWAFLPVEVQRPEVAAITPITRPAIKKVVSDVPSEAVVEAVARVELRRLSEKPVETVDVASVTLPQFFRLVGTVVEPGRAGGSKGIFAMGLSEMKVAGAGEKVAEGIEVVEVRDASAMLNVGGKRVEIKVEKKETETPAGEGGTP